MSASSEQTIQVAINVSRLLNERLENCLGSAKDKAIDIAVAAPSAWSFLFFVKTLEAVEGYAPIARAGEHASILRLTLRINVRAKSVIAGVEKSQTTHDQKERDQIVNELKADTVKMSELYLGPNPYMRTSS